MSLRKLTLYGSACVSGANASRPAALCISAKWVSMCGAKYFLAWTVASSSLCLCPLRTNSIYCCRRNSNSSLFYTRPISSGHCFQ